MEELTPWPIVDRDVQLRDGRTLSYAEWGEPSGQPVLLFHGSPSSRLFCPDPAATAAAGVHLVTIDRPGYGRSDHQPGRTILDWPADVEQLADTLGLARFAVVAHSAGGPYALACSAQLPARVTRIALVSCVVPIDEVPAAGADLDDGGRSLVELARRNPEQAAAAIATAASWLVDEPERFLTLPRPASDEQLLQDPQIRAMYLAAVREAVRQGLSGYARDEVLERRPWGFRLADIGATVTVWHGDQDQYIPRTHAEAMVGRLRQARAEFFPDLAHGLILQRWTTVLDDLVGV
ncbi:MAG TPA: alpha/beta hydrolase [Actinoplanes sp.]|jgi:pimeloyl-ACP methyl ester carboxylesterase